MIRPHLDGLIGADGFFLVDTDIFRAVICYGESLIISHRLIFVVFDGNGPIFLAVEKDFFFAFFVLEAQLIGSAAA